eukprot:6959952-Prymnesium_polylepis.2
MEGDDRRLVQQEANVARQVCGRKDAITPTRASGSVSSMSSVSPWAACARRRAERCSVSSCSLPTGRWATRRGPLMRNEIGAGTDMCGVGLSSRCSCARVVAITCGTDATKTSPRVTCN